MFINEAKNLNKKVFVEKENVSMFKGKLARFFRSSNAILLSKELIKQWLSTGLQMFLGCISSLTILGSVQVVFLKENCCIASVECLYSL